MAAAWAEELSGELVASNENPDALDDLEWLDLEADAMVGLTRKEHVDEVVKRLLQSGKAYLCYCSSAEDREMPPNPSGDPEDVLYDNRHRDLNAEQRKALKKSGRLSSVRLIVEEPRAELTDSFGRSLGRRPPHDFMVVDRTKQPSAAVRRVADILRAGSTHVVFDDTETSVPAQVLSILEALEHDLEGTLAVPSWPGPDVAPPTMGELRSQGYLAPVVKAWLAELLWGQPAAGSPSALLEAAEPWTAEALAERNGAHIRDLSPSQLAHTLGEHLTRRGYPFLDREPEWQERFAEVVQRSLKTLGDAEPMAAALLQASVDYDRQTAAELRRPEASELLDTFEAAIASLEGQEEPDWHGLIRGLRRQVPAPARALSTLRVIMTGQREGPPLRPVLTLLGVEGCRARIAKARRYAS